MENKKDTWDKVSILGQFFSGVVIALVGLMITVVYNNRQAELAALQKQEEIAARKIEIVQTFFEHFASEDERQQRSALDTIVALGEPELASRIATNFGGGGARLFLKDLLVSSEGTVAEAAQTALDIIRLRSATKIEQEINYRLALFNDLFADDGTINGLVLSEIQNILSDTPPGQQDFMVGGSRFLRPDMGDRTLLNLFGELRAVTLSSKHAEIEKATIMLNELKKMIVSTPKREIQLTDHVIDDIANFDTDQRKKIQNFMLPSLEPWTRKEP